MKETIIKSFAIFITIAVLSGLVWIDAQWENKGLNIPISSNHAHNSQQKHLDTQTPKHASYQTHKHLQFRQTSFDTYILQLDTTDIQFFWRTQSAQKHQSIQDLQLQLEEKGQSLVFATNGGMFSPSFRPVGLYIEEGETLQSINLKNEKGNFYMQPNGIFGISKERTAHVFTSKKFDENWELNLQYATQSGPMLLIDGKIHPKFGRNSANKYIRSGVGIIDSNTIVFAISNEPVNFYDFARLFLEEFSCQNALYLDGVISEMYLPELGRFDSVGKFGVIIGVSKRLEL